MKLAKPGIYAGVPFADYHGDCAPGPSVSASTLIQLEQRCPAYAWARHYLNPAPVEDEDTEATAFGRAAHCYIVEGAGEFSERYLLKPRGMNFARKDGIEWRKSVGDPWLAEHVGGEIITTDDFETIYAMAKAIDANPGTAGTFTEGQPEQTLIVQDRETGIWLKARPDYLRGSLALNYKTAAAAKLGPWRHQAGKLGYHIGAAVCLDVMTALGIKDAAYGYIVQETVPPYVCIPRRSADRAIEWGRKQYRQALRTFAECLASGKWPDYGSAIEEVDLPPFAEFDLEERREAGEFRDKPSARLLRVAAEFQSPLGA